MATLAGTGPKRFHWSRERLFYGFMGLAILALVLLGFGRSWVLRGVLPDGPRSTLPVMVHIHGAVFLAWVLLFISQAALISARNHRWHRIMGFTSLGLAAAMLVLGVEVTVGQYHRGSGPPGIDPLSWMAVPLFDLPVFAALVGAGVAWRHRPQVHKRLMLLATCVLLQAAMGRLQYLPPGFLNGEGMTLIGWALTLPVLGWDLATRGRPHPATLAGIGLLGAEQLVRVAVWQTEGWRAFAAWLVAVWS